MYINLNLRGESRLSEANVEKVNISPFSGPSMTVLKKYELIHQFVCLFFYCALSLYEWEYFVAVSILKLSRLA